MTCGDLGFLVIRGDPVTGRGTIERGSAGHDRGAIPERAVLVAQQNEVAGVIET